MRQFTPPNSKLVPKEAKCVFRGVLYSVWQWQQEMFDGSKETFEMLKGYDSVDIITVVNQKILIQTEVQPFVGEFTSVPGGRNDIANEDELACAKRELREETGYSLERWNLVHCTQPSRKVEKLFYVFIAFGGCQKESASLDVGEDISSRLVSFDEFKSLAPKMRCWGTIREVVEQCTEVDDLLNLPAIYQYDK